MLPLEVTFPGEASSVPDARHAVERALRAWGLVDLSWPAALLVSELAANVTLHARTPYTLVLERLGEDAVRLSVRDGSVRMPRPRSYGEEATTGRGLRLVEEIARAWGVDVHEAGKTVWVDIAAVEHDGRWSDDAAEDEVDLEALLAAFPDVEDDAPRARAA